MTGAQTPSPIIAVVGSTASGKTGLSLDLAEALSGEIVNTDAMAVYRGMDIGTAKPSIAQRRSIRHHLLDLLDVTQPATVATFQRLARGVIAELRARRTPSILVGGSALYVRAVLDHFDFPGTDEALRARLEVELAELGAPALHARLQDIDPDSAARIGQENGRRIVRAMEVWELTGQPLSATLPRREYVDAHTIQIGVTLERDLLNRRIADRVSAMFADGFVDEVERLLAAGLAEGRTASRAIGYRQVAAYLRGACSLDEARESTVNATRQFARRQDAWWRKDPRIHWVRHDDPDRLAQALAAVEKVAH